MTPAEVKWLKKIEAYVTEKMEPVDGGHDISHIKRVLSNAKKINEQEQADAFLVEAGVLLHDITDEKLFHKKQAEKDLNAFLKEINLEKELRHEIFRIINAVSFGAEFDEKIALSLVQKVVRDADRLDAIGAVGIARTFHYGGKKNRKMFDAAIAPQKYKSAQEYRKSKAPTINHFYEKLLLLKDRMETKTGKKLAGQRHEFMLGYLNQFYDEIGEEGFVFEEN